MKLYNDYSSYLKDKYGCKVHRISLDAGFGCPGRCSYCNEAGSRASYINPGKTVKDQLRSRIEYFKNKGSGKFIAYFQAFTNTYAPVEKLRSIYDQILGFEEVVGISIGTRPDTIDKDKLKLISSYKERYEVWVFFKFTHHGVEPLRGQYGVCVDISNEVAGSCLVSSLASPSEAFAWLIHNAHASK